MASVHSLLAKLRRPSSSADSDRMLLARFATTGDETAFAALVDRHGPLVLGVCRRTVRDHHLAEDAFQAVFLVLAKKAGRVSVRESLANYLYVVARRVAVKAARRRQAAPVVPAAGEAAEQPDVAGRFELSCVLDEELGRLPEKYRSPLIACYLEDRTQDETAAWLGWSLSTVRRRLDAGRELLRHRLTARGVTLGSGAFAAAVSVPAALARDTVAAAVGVHAGAAVGPHLLPLVNEGLRMSSNVWKIGASLVGVAAAVAVGVAVSNGEEKPKPEIGPRQLITAPAQVVKWSTIKGRVVWPGQAPAIAPIAVTADKEHCLSKGALEPDELVVNKKNGGLKNVWVYLRPDDDDRAAAFKPADIHPDLLKPKAKEHDVDQPCCQFVPRILALRAGDTIKFKNSAPIPHNVHFDSNEATESFNMVIAPVQSLTSKPLTAERVPVTFKCDIHPWMKGYALVFAHPYFAVTDADGNFEIKNAPIGKYRIVYRHERGYHKGKDGSKGFPVEIAGTTTELDPLKYEEPAK
ncbi:sigma-70 family RNA polymerase sigma factor [Limnoglobus roseus]|uniref:Putative lipoprotein n=1 Tax=Limnoglobus roseus TaxID=2598579 RepID=A0A5C1A847_9BACT|nr:sigma-70 family RNA polymerase sigma factor [Limnoglobus roseus]QEL15381.1 putative lipoprotein [Limnoglobus roseus]